MMQQTRGLETYIAIINETGNNLKYCRILTLNIYIFSILKIHYIYYYVSIDIIHRLIQLQLYVKTKLYLLFK